MTEIIYISEEKQLSNKQNLPPRTDRDRLHDLAEIAYNTYFATLKIDTSTFDQLPLTFQAAWVSVANKLQEKFNSNPIAG